MSFMKFLNVAGVVPTGRPMINRVWGMFRLAGGGGAGWSILNS